MINKTPIIYGRMSDSELQMFEAVQRYHHLKKSDQVRMLIKKEFWRLYPEGTDIVNKMLEEEFGKNE